MTTYPLPTLAASITAAGISAPAYEDVLGSLQATGRSIFGSDIVLDNSTQDGQLLGVVSQAIDDCNGMAIAVYNAFSPAKAQGVGLSSVVKINGLRRETPSNSTADMTIVGETGTTILNGLIGDQNGFIWQLPASITIPDAGDIIVEATCTTTGAISAAANTITRMLNPTQGWQSATNVNPAVPGQPVEDDVELRSRQTVSTSIPAQSVLDAIIGLIANLPGIGAANVRGYENDTGTPDGNGLPGHSISLLVNGGDPVAIANLIAITKTPGTATYGTTSEMIVDAKGVPNTINFFRPTNERVVATINLTPLTGYLSSTGTAIQQALSNFVSTVGLGDNVPWFEAVGALNLGAPLNSTYTITSLTLALFGNSQGQADVDIPFNGLPGLALSDITLNVS